jgi:outer membrane protein
MTRTRKQGILVLLLGVGLFMIFAFPARAMDVPDAIRKRVKQEFPGATITEIRKDVYNGLPVTEVEFITEDGTEYEMIVTEDGGVLSVEEEKGLPWIGGELSLGLGVMVERDIYKGVDTEVQPAPFLRYENGPFEIRAYEGVDATYTFFRTDRFSVAVGGFYEQDEGYDPDDSDYLKGMKTLDDLFGAGLYLETEVAGFTAGLQIHQDLSGESDGQEVELSVFYPWFVAGFEIRPELSVTWLSEKTVDYYYGVSAGEARSDRPVYSPSSSFAFGLGLMIQRPIFGDFTAVGMVEASTFGSEIKDSPLVDEDFGWDAVFGVTYAF